MQRMVETTSNISNIEYKQLEFDNYQAVFEAPSVKTIEMSAYEATDIIKDGIQAVSTGTLAGVGAFGVATSFGIASTGTAISTLSGAAATNATLAWLGGGSLAAGGLGIAGGSAVLGGIIAIPALLVFAAKTTAKSEEALTQAFEQQAEYEIATHEAESLIAKVACVTARVQETYEVTEEMAKYFEIILSANQSTVSAKMDQKEQLRKETEASRAKYAKRFFLLRWLDKALGKEPSFEYEDPLDFSNFSEHDRKSYLMMLSFGFALYAVLKVKILEEDGSLASDAQVLINSGRDMLRRKS